MTRADERADERAVRHVASRANPFFRTLRQLTDDAAARRAAGVVPIEGVHLCGAFLDGGGVPRAVVIGRGASEDAEVVSLLDRAPAVELHVLDDALFRSVSALVQGVSVLMLIDRPPTVEPPRLSTDAVLLDRVQDPGNVGSILRSAAAAGIGQVYLSAACADAWSPKVLRAAMGAHFHLGIFEGCDLVGLVHDSAVACIATGPHASRSLHDADLRGRVAWLFGHEGQGVDPTLMDAASSVRIPQPGSVESLNVAASAAVCFFEQARQRAAGQPPGSSARSV